MYGLSFAPRHTQLALGCANAAGEEIRAVAQVAALSSARLTLYFATRSAFAGERRLQRLPR